MSNLKKKKYIALLGIIVIVLGLIGLFTFGRIDKYKGKIKVKNVVSKTTSLSASVSTLVENETQSKGSDIIKYEISYTLDSVAGVDTRDVVIRGRLNDEQGKYARFKEINKNNITSTLSNDGKEIEVHIDDAPLGVENNITLRLVINNAPNGFKVRPQITIQEATGEENNVVVNEVEVVTNSITGTVKDNKNLNVSNIELSLRDENGEVKRTYTDEDGRFVFSDIENKTYTVNVEEEIYAKVSEEEVEGNLIIKVKEVTPYELEAHKYITKLDLVVNGKEEHYTYDDLEKVVQNVKNAKTISGKISYKISIKNIGEKAGRISRITDTVDEGLSFDKDKNIGWTLKEGNLYYEMAEGTVIKPNETKDIVLVLDIKNTNQIKTYINEADVNGETYERVVYILNGEKYREEDVILGSKLVEPVITDPSFSGWYTDKNFTNKYNFKNEVTKDLILYGKTEVIKHTVEFYDKNPQTSVETKWDEQEIEDGKKATEPNSPSHEGYEFECWMDEQDNIWNFNNPVERDLRLTSCYSVITYHITYDGLTPAEKTALNNPPTYTIETPTITLNNPSNRSDEYGETEAFIGWTGSNGTNPSSVVKIEQGSTGDKHYEAHFEPIAEDEYTILYDLDGGEYDEGVSNPSKYKKRTETFTLNNPHKDYYDFLGWTGTGLSELTTTVTIPKGSEGNREYVAHYQRRTHNVIFNDYDVESATPEETVTQFGNPSTVNEGEPVDQPRTNPSHTGYTCDKWSTKINGDYNNDAYDFSTPVMNELNLYTLCKKNPYTVTYMDGDLQYATDTVLYKEKTTKPADDPTKNHHIFTGWTLNGELFDFNTPITEDITLYSSYEEVKAPEVSHTPTEWTNQDVTVTVSKNSAVVDPTGYTYKYRVENGSYSTYEGPFSIGENCDIYAVAYKSGVASEETKHEIRNIDKIKPTIDDLSQTGSTGTSVEINFTSHDNESGVGEHRIYLDDDYRGTISYTGNPQTKTDSYEISELTAGQTYTVKLYTVDVAGNISDVAELEVTTEDRIVCQIIGRNGELYNDETLNEPFSTLRGAIQSCGQNQCTIQMLESVNETNDVLEGQDITLDLNGKNVSGVRDYTLDISGDFILIDDGATNKGMIYNNIDSAVKIEAGGKFTMGINEILNPEVSTTTPYVWGKYYGVKRLEDATFNFYDGAVRGEVAISGEVDDAPYMYTASVTSYDDEETPYQVATLKILDDAEARIKTKYYTKLATAVAEAKKGYYENLMSDSTLDENLKKSNNYTYGFVKNGQGYLESENNTRYSSAQSEFNISLEDSDSDKELVMSTYRTSDSPDNDQAEIRIEEYEVSSDPQSSSNVLKNSYTMRVPVGEDTINIPLRKNCVYKISLYNYIWSSTPETSKFIVKDMYLKNIEADTEDTSIDKEHSTNYTKQYGFDYDEETGTYTSNNNFENGTTAFSYVEFDLTSESTDKLLTLRATYDGMYSSDYGNVIVKENNTIETYYNYNGLVYINAYNSNQRNYIGPYTYQTKLTAGKKYYVQFYYFKSSSSLPKSAYEATGCKDEFKIFDIRLTNYDIVDTSNTSTTYNLRTEEGVNQLVKNTEYGFDVPRNGNYGYSYDTYDAYLADSYMAFDLRNSTSGKTVTFSYDSFYCYNTDVGCKLYAMVTDSAETPEGTDGSFFLRENNLLSVNGRGVLEPGKINYVHILYDKPVNQGEPGDNYATSYVRLNQLSVSNGINYYLPSELVTEGEYGWTGSGSMSPNNRSSSQQGTTAHSYMKIDLTGSMNPEYLKVNMYGYADMAIVVDNSKNEPASRDGAAFTNANNHYYSGEINIPLTPNQVNYVHFLSTNVSNQSYTLSTVYRYPGEPIDLNTSLKRSPNKAKGFTFDNYSYYTPGSISQGETADSYIEFDLTNASKDKIVDMYLYLNTYDRNYKYVYLSNSKYGINYANMSSNRENALICYSYANSYYYYINGTNVAYNDTHFNVVLPKGNKYYLHFATYGNTTYTSDYLKIKGVSMYDSNETDFRTGYIPYYDTSHEGSTPELPGDQTVDEQNENNFRFIGKEPNNYISFNNDRWRIIGVFNVEGENGVEERRIKIASNSYFGGYIYDTTPYASTAINGGYGINEWSQADLMKLLNPGFEDNEEEIFKYENSEYVSDGVQSVNNSLYWNKGTGKCFTGQYNQAANCNFTSTGLNDSAKQFIDTVVWNYGALPYNNTNVSPYQIYSYEKGNNTTKSSTYNTQGIDDTVTRGTKWLGKVGLPSISDYLMATGDYTSSGSVVYTREQCLAMQNSNYGACTNSNDWFVYSNSSPMTVMNAVFGSNSSGNYPTLNYVAFPATIYSGAMPATSMTYHIRPAVYLSTKTIVTGGTGTWNDPYTIELGSTKNPDEYYGFVPSGEDDPDASVITQEEESLDWDKVKNEPTYGFTYNQETDEFINDNIDVPKSTASAYVEIDLTNEVEDKELNVSIDMSTYSANAYILLMEDSFKDINYINLYNDGVIDGTKYFETSANGVSTRVYNLTHGKKYYLQFIYRKMSEYGVTDNYSDTMKVKMNINADTIHTTEIKSYDGRVPVLNQEVDTVQILKNISTTSSVQIEATKDMVLDLNGYTLTTTANDYVIKNNGHLKIIDSGYDREEAISEAEYNVAMNTYNEQKQSYVSQVAQEKIDTEAAMAEYNQRSYVNDGLMMNLSSKEYGDTENVWKDLSGNNLDQTITTSSIDPTTGGYFASFAMNGIDEDNYKISYEITMVANNNAGFVDKNGIWTAYENNNSVSNRLTVNQDYRTTDRPKALTFTEGNTFTLTLTKSGSVVKCYINGELFDSFFAVNQDSYTSQSIHGAKILGVRAYNRVLTPSEVKHNFDVDNALYDIKDVNGTALLEYQFSDANNDLIIENQNATSTFSRNTREPYTMGTYTYDELGDIDIIRSLKSYPFYTDFTKLKVNVTKYNTTDTLYIGLSKNLPYTPYSSEMDLSFYDTYITVPANDSAIQTVIDIKPETYGDYFLVVMSKDGHAIHGVDFTVEQPVKSTASYSGTIRGTRGIINNNQGAYLDVDQGIIYSDSTSNYPCIYNNGTLTLGDHGVIDGTPSVGIDNKTYGDILDGSGTFGNITAIDNNSSVEEGFGGYTGPDTAVITNNGYKDLTLTDLTGFTINQTRGYKMTIADSNIRKATVNIGSGTIELNNTTAYDVTIEYGTGNLIDSAVDRNLSVTKGGKLNIDSSTINTVSGDYGSNTREDVLIKNSTVTCARSNSAFQSLDNLTIIGTLELGERCRAGSIYTSDFITLGDKEDEVDTTKPKIDSVTSAVINFYDGRVKQFSKMVGDIADDYEIVKIMDDGEEYFTLGNDEVAEINGTRYNSLAAAIAAVPDNSQTIITILKDIYNVRPITIPENKIITIDYNGHSINSMGNDFITNNGVLTLDDLTENPVESKILGNYIVNNGELHHRNVNNNAADAFDASVTIVNNGTFDMEGGTLISKTVSVSGEKVPKIENHGVMNVTGGNQGSYTKNFADSTLNIENGTITKDTLNYGDMLVTGGNLGYYTITNYNNLTIRGVETGSLINSYGTTLVDDSNLGTTIIVYQGTTTVKDSTIRPYQVGVIVSGSTGAKAIIDNSTIDCNTSYDAISISQQGTVDIINNSIIKDTDDHTRSYTGIQIQNSGNLNFLSGSISRIRGINNSGNGNIVFGVKDGEVSKTSPSIKGSTYGFNNTNSNSKVYFYDGIFAGPVNGSLTSVVTETETGYEIITINHDLGEAKVLSGDPLIKNKTTGIEYDNIQQAVDESSTGDTLELMRDLTTLTSYPTVNVGSTKDVIIDTKGFNIVYNGTSGSFIDNSGTLKMIDSEGSTIITNNTANALIINEATGDFEIDGFDITLVSNPYMISNAGTADVKNITLTTTIGKLAFNTGTIEITTCDYEGTINSNDSFIRNEGTMELNNNSLELTAGYDSVGHYSYTPLLISNTGNINIVDGTYKSINSKAISSSGNGYISINQNNTLYIEGSVFNSDDSSIAFNGGRLFKTTYNNNQSIQLNDQSIFTINGGYIEMKIDVNDSSKLNVIGGTTLFAAGYTLVSEISADPDTEITIGTKDDNIDLTTPKISNTISSEGVVNMYDGIVNGLIYADEINIEDNSTLVYNPSYNSHLVYDNQIKNVDQNKDYISIQEAINEVGTGETLQMIRQGSLNDVYIQLEQLTIPTGKNFTFDTNGRSIYTIKENIINNGYVVMTNSLTNESLIRTLIINNTQSDIKLLTNNSHFEVNGLVEFGLYGASDVVYNQQQTAEFIYNSGSQNTQINKLINYGSFILESGYVERIENKKTGIMNGGAFDTLDNTSSFTVNGGSIGKTTNSSTFIINNGTSYGGSSGGASYTRIYNTGNLTINNITCSSCANFIYSTRSVTVNGGTFSIPMSSSDSPLIQAHSNNAVTNINGGTFNAGTGSKSAIILLTTDYNTVPTATIKDITTDIPIGDVNGKLTLDNVTVNSNQNYPLLTIKEKGNVTVKDTVSLTSTKQEAINNKGKLYVGTKDGNVSTTNPIIKGETKGLINDTGSSFYFYDGVISGKEAAIVGPVTETETDYSVKITDDGTYKNAFLKTTADIEKVVVVNNINYDTIQAAINAVEENKATDMILYTNYTLEENIVVPANKTIEFYYNGYTLNLNGYAFTGEGTVNFHDGAPTGVGGAIYRFFANITGTEINPKDIVIYQMDNGEELSPATTYKLYKLMDGEYKVVKVNETEIGDYSLGAEKEILRTTTGQINIKGIGEGTYKLVGSDGKELSFNIDENSVSNNIRVDRYTSKAKQSIHVVATLILTLQTGVIRQPFVVVISILLLTTIGFITYNRYKKEDLK